MGASDQLIPNPRQRLRPLPSLRPPPRLNPITGITDNMLGPQPTDMEFPRPATAAEARGQLTPSPITDTDMVMQTTDTVCPQDMPTFLVVTTMARGPLKLNLIMAVMEDTVMVMVMVTVMAVVMVIMVKPFLAEPNHGMGIIYLIIHAYFLTLLKKQDLPKISHILAAQKKNIITMQLCLPT